MAVVRQAIDRVSAFETPEVLAEAGVDLIVGRGRFEDPHTLLVGERTGIRARHILLCTGAWPVVREIPGLKGMPYWNCQTVWQQTRLPAACSPIVWREPSLVPIASSGASPSCLSIWTT